MSNEDKTWVRVHFTETNEFVAEVTYRELAEALGKDISENGTADIEEIPSRHQIGQDFYLTDPGHPNGKKAGAELADLLASRGAEVDSYLPMVELIEGTDPEAEEDE